MEIPKGGSQMIQEINSTEEAIGLVQQHCREILQAFFGEKALQIRFQVYGAEYDERWSLVADIFPNGHKLHWIGEAVWFKATQEFKYVTSFEEQLKILITKYRQYFDGLI